MLSELIKQPSTGGAAEILVFIIGSKILQFSFENEIANLIYTSMQVEKVYLLPNNRGYLIKNRYPFMGLIRGERPNSIIWIIRFRVHLKAYWGVISQICPINEVERESVGCLRAISL